MTDYLSLLFALQFDIDSGSPVPLQGDALGRSDDHKVAHFLHMEWRVRVHADRFALYQLELVVISCGCKNILHRLSSTEFIE